MDLKETILEKLKGDIDLVEEILTYLGSDSPITDNNGDWYFTTVCHHGDSHKLHFHKDSLLFTCYTNCGNMSIFDLISNHYDIEFKESIKWLTKFLNINYHSCTTIDIKTSWKKRLGTYREKRKLKWRETKNKKSKKKPLDIKFIEEPILGGFLKNTFYHKWVEEGINTRNMRLFNIRFDISNNRIIIPHYYVNNKLLGVKCRNLNKYEIDNGMKYIFVDINGITRRYPTNINLYGIHVNKEIISKTKTCVLFEAEKSVMKYGSFYGIKNNISLATMGTNLTDFQIDLLKSLGVENVYLAWDKEFEQDWIDSPKDYKRKMKKLYSFTKKIVKATRRLMSKGIKVNILWDNNNLLEIKDAPIDKGRLIFNKLMRDSYYVSDIYELEEDFFNLFEEIFEESSEE